MIQNGLNKLYWGFLFTMVSFRILGFDIFPDIVGYLLFASGFQYLSSFSNYFKKASKYNMVLIFLSIFTIYQPQSEGVQVGPFGLFISILHLVVDIIVVYHLFKGIRETVEIQGNYNLAEEADRKWRNYLFIQLAGVFILILIFIPPLAFLYVLVMLVLHIAVLIGIMGYIKRCKESV